MPMKWVVTVVVILIVGAGAWYWWSTQGQVPEAPASDTQQLQEQQGVPAQPQSASQQQLLNSASGVSNANADLNADLQAIDAQIDDAAQSSDSAQSFNDQPIEQTE